MSEFCVCPEPQKILRDFCVGCRKTIEPGPRPKYCYCHRPSPSAESALLCLACKAMIKGAGDGPTIPLEMSELFRKVIELCKEAGCGSVDLKVDPGWKSSFYGQIQAQWHSGRHGVPATCAIRTELLSHIEV